ncbi:hypothetical protein Tamer19_13380 [Cupriavidus sp. TA19]|uniref:hypothetical protein n=1 Tax=unclassified Cupriavidus TaxID=2640874 RepID=UPI0027294B1C|nr:hypothetical protein [Cupriavidus sp. TA19]GLC91930.1 hypothetical protein Tamer19_13380 [Cupriavidus sp. TA19]
MSSPHYDYPQPETVLAIRGAIAIGRQAGPRPPNGSWLTEFWEVGHVARNAANAIHEAIEPLQRMVCDATAHLQGHVATLERAAGDIDGLYPERFKDEPMPAATQLDMNQPMQHAIADLLAKSTQYLQLPCNAS